MKKLFAILTIGLVMATVGNTQAQSWSIGPVAGFGHSYLSNMQNQDFKPSYKLGVEVMRATESHWAYGAEISASHEGFKMENEATNTEWSVNPIYARVTPKVYYMFGDNMNMVRPHINVGPSVAFKVDEDMYLNDDRLSDDALLPQYQSEVFQDIDFGVNVGAGAAVSVTDRTSLNFEGSYYNGLVDVTDNDNMNRNLRFNVGVMFGLGSRY